MPKSLYPTITDPVIITTRDGTFFICWVEATRGAHRWIFIDADRVRYVGPRWSGEGSLDAIRELVGEWWDTVRGIGRAPDMRGVG